MNELRTITSNKPFHKMKASILFILAQQVQEMHNSLELQYWTRLSEMRNRYESNLQQSPSLPKSSKHFNGAPR